MTRENQISLARNRSNLEEVQLVIESVSQREYFRFGEQRLIEYQLTKANNKIIKFQPEEQDGEKDFAFSTF